MASLILLLSELVRVQGTDPASLPTSQLNSSNASVTASSCAAVAAVAAAASSRSTGAKQRPVASHESYYSSGEDLQEARVCVDLVWP
ncbi:hypothetical protein ACJRO7_019327 [Eucalyptus globulus]|uniref:Secreted protein n=1 Tax=Eucalyptus globulus TaxID=34317 RepID=A0ABD3KL37_EUCGL